MLIPVYYKGCFIDWGTRNADMTLDLLLTNVPEEIQRKRLAIWNMHFARK